MTVIVFGSPARYYQGPGCLDRVGEILANIGKRAAAIVADAQILPALEPRLREALDQTGIASQFLPVAGDVTNAAVSALQDEITRGPLCSGIDVVLALGGGKAIDLGKALSYRLECSVVTIPTAATNDAPTSKHYVLYDEQHVLLEIVHLKASPAAVVVDTQIIATAPRTLLAAGIGDAVTKGFEAAQCYAANSFTMFGQMPSLAALTLAEGSYRVLREHAVTGMTIAGTGKPTPAFEALIEAMFLMGGLGFESGGLSIAHSMTRGLSRIPKAATAMHGQQVAYGLLVQLVLEGRDDVFLDDLRFFYNEIGLATSLRGLGFENVSNDDYRSIAGPTLQAPHAKNFNRILSENELIDAMRALEEYPSAVRHA